ncbi:aldo/keto reductase [Pelosinus sp. sgz500959]|uniref:aldo/keto reductase n=1 Tax=Pelosinus sp. sgz500959 TaxID=3242472 RepID=UPI0036700B45
MIKGSATLEGTLNYAQKYPLLVYQPLVPTGIRISGAGFGCYRVDVRVKEHQQALTKALLSGINLIDTSANYADGGSERLVGKVLCDLITANKIKREEFVIVSKVGYLQGENYSLSQERKSEGQPFKDLVLYDKGLEHCIHPEFLAEQLTRSLDRLGIETVDCYLLHNPEYYLNWAKQAQVPKIDARAEYLRRIRIAFLHLEEEVAAGRIQYYGLSSNTFPRPASHFDFTSLADIWDIAQSISPQHHFRVIQFPLNLLETAGVTEKNQPGGKSLVEFAVDKGLGILTNRPLNAIREERLIRLSENVYQGEANRQANEFKSKVAMLDPGWINIPALSQLALRALRSTAGITAVLMGMRQEVYVEDVLHELRQPCEVVERKKTWKHISEL